MQEQILEQVNTAREALRHLSEIQDVDIATAPKEVVWEDGKVKLLSNISLSQKKILEQMPQLIGQN